MPNPLDLENTRKTPRGYGNVILQEVQCRGNESYLSDCINARIITNIITPDVVAVTCGKMKRICWGECIFVVSFAYQDVFALLCSASV